MHGYKHSCNKHDLQPKNLQTHMSFYAGGCKSDPELAWVFNSGKTRGKRKQNPKLLAKRQVYSPKRVFVPKYP